MGVLLCVSRIDQEILAYAASIKTRSNDDMLGKRRKKILRDLHRIPPANRYLIIKKIVDRPDIDHSLREVRKVRNNLAHNVDTVSSDSVFGNYELPIFYSRNYLKNVLENANDCFTELTKVFEEHPKYIQWTKNKDSD